MLRKGLKTSLQHRQHEFNVSYSTDLTNWAPLAGGAEKIGDASPGIERWQLSVPIGEGEAGFARLRATSGG